MGLEKQRAHMLAAARQRQNAIGPRPALISPAQSSPLPNKLKETPSNHTHSTSRPQGSTFGSKRPPSLDFDLSDDQSSPTRASGVSSRGVAEPAGRKWTANDLQLLALTIENADIFNLTAEQAVFEWRAVGEFVGRDPAACLEMAIRNADDYTKLSKLKGHREALVGAERKPATVVKPKPSPTKQPKVITISDSDSDTTEPSKPAPATTATSSRWSRDELQRLLFLCEKYTHGKRAKPDWARICPKLPGRTASGCQSQLKVYNERNPRPAVPFANATQPPKHKTAPQPKSILKKTTPAYTFDNLEGRKKTVITAKQKAAAKKALRAVAELLDSHKVEL